MEAYKDKTDKVEEQDAGELLRENGYSEIVIDHWLNSRNLGEMRNYHGYSEKITSSCDDSM